MGDIATDVVAVLPAPLAGGLALGTDTAVRIGLTPGGSAANTATWLAGTGTPVTLIGAVGADAAGAARLAELSAAGVRPAVARVAAATGAIVVLSDPQERTMLCDRGANQLLPVAHATAAVRDAGDAVHLHLSAYPLFDPGSAPAALAALDAARQAGLTVSVDAASAGPLAAAGSAAHDWLRGADLLFANLDEARVLVGDPTADPADAARELTGLARSVVVKLGAAGAIRADGDRLLRAEAVPVDAVDPTGAGDAFAAGLLAAELAGADPLAALRAGAALGARAVSQLGARP
ncbi:carbohydrate kinase family protein [Actinocatenispora thailandica]|nr:PfkB family carbohydrate kinase [Actinocatenispora thailandica]